jgi:predicted naringenin-chalcone synthase
MFLQSIASATPSYNYSQKDCFDAMSQASWFEKISARSQTILQKVLLGNSGIQQRQFSLPHIQDVFDRDAEQLNQHFEQAAPSLAGEALVKALKKANLLAADLDALFVCTCTGYLCPGVSSYIAEQMNLRHDIFLCDQVGLGCGAAIPMLRVAEGFLATNPNARIATVAVEICSAAFFVDQDPGVLISLCLFGDGASAAIWSNDKSENNWKIGNFQTIHQPKHREKIRFINDSGKLKNQLHRDVPELAAKAVTELFLRRKNQPDQILTHTGGRDVIEAIEEKLPFSLLETREILANHGNISSPSIMFSLEKRFATNPEDKNLWLTSFGAGFAAHSCELSLD